MASYNRIVMVGNLTRDPEYKQLASGQAVCRLGLASNRQFKNKQTGSMVQEVCYIDIDVWGPQAESCRQYLSKGRPVLVEGRLKLDSWEDQNGNARSKHSIVADRVVFLGSNVATDEDVASPADVAKAVPDKRQTAPRSPSLSEAAGVSRDESEQLEQNLLDQIDQIKQKSKKTVQPAKKAVQREESNKQDDAQEDDDSGDAVFKDQPPFEDDLPF